MKVSVAAPCRIGDCTSPAKSAADISYVIFQPTLLRRRQAFRPGVWMSRVIHPALGLPQRRGAQLVCLRLLYPYLVIDDNAPIHGFLRVPLETEGHSMIEAGTAREGILAVVRQAPGRVILPLGLPDADRLTVLREIRGWSSVAALVLSVRADEAGKGAALAAGAQDYLVKPIGMNELFARIRAPLRDRARAATATVIETLGLRIDFAKHSVAKSGLPLHLTRRDFDLLWLQASHAVRLVTQAMILKSLWGPLWGPAHA